MWQETSSTCCVFTFSYISYFSISDICLCRFDQTMHTILLWYLQPQALHVVTAKTFPSFILILIIIYLYYIYI